MEQRKIYAWPSNRNRRFMLKTPKLSHSFGGNFLLGEIFYWQKLGKLYVIFFGLVGGEVL